MALYCSLGNSPISSNRVPRNFANQTPFLAKSLIPMKSAFEKSRISTFAPTILCNAFIQKPLCCSSSNLSNGPDKLDPPTTIIFIKGLAQSTSEGGLKTAFSRFGGVSRVKIIMDKKTKQPVGFAYVWFTREEFAQTAVEEMNGKFFNGKFIYVTLAKPGSCKPRAKAKPYKF
ncbi:organelle RRM domain-containing protein 6, chloroplastic isoform X2 [Olea europaea var. sylvestris]|uniref:organelle RRM domain-containing protein 6, chloroplastic isoform X2 n=1 Tax=Olea europaea var. sylvestris TaxID=158386 RepID=UPI000C1CE94F|nr:organelle RRM domain-containing protein 6, chloroplastic isoform X2 [Olea europaea var. sylvestris]